MTSPPHAMNDISNIAKIILIVATIVLLLLVAISIIARSYVLRQRQRAIIAEAIRNGTYVVPKKPGTGPRPVMYQVALTKELENDVVPRGEKESMRLSIEKEKRRQSRYDGLAVKWHKMMPVSCRLVDLPKSLSDDHPPSPMTAPPTPIPPARPRSSRVRWSWPVIVRREPSPLLPTTVDDVSPPEEPPPPPSSPIPEQPSRPVSMAPTLVAEPRPSTSMTTRALSPVPSEKHPRSPTPAATLVAPTPAPPEERVRVAVLIAMPFALSIAAKRASEYGDGTPPLLPSMEFGVCEVPLDEPLEAPKWLPSSTPLPPLGEVSSADDDGEETERAGVVPGAS
ncbi:hypothetical protein PYCCODRAFT_1439145 [Trametes coccinea BRFM310]|uniref:Uncharacterized protein n=1 Tax=Trametes coccinea (strain BRFM310) TaxID=1353009 RepID=A0A1Y2ID86_TRAC3|nr:hypothetical protein PYCCODRAFT_1439145 [Trametes coccinea BRFM310]